MAQIRIFLLISVLTWCEQVIFVAAQLRTDRICATARFNDQCEQLQRGSTEVNCQRVQDSIECAQRLRNGTADFGIFSAESTLLLATLKWEGLTVIKELRHRDRLQHLADFESVVVVRADHRDGISGLSGKNYCHPGFYYDRSERWSERFLKHFERTVVAPQINCDVTNDSTTPAEIETAALARFFNLACRPGAWSNNPEEDAKLKAKYPQLCELCSSTTSNCEYSKLNEATSSKHHEALKCMLNKGQVAYVSLSEAQTFFSLPEYTDFRANYAYLCPNGTLQIITDNSTPCTWLRQPWPLIISHDARTIDLSTRINGWTRSASKNWELTLKEILTADSYMPVDTTIQKPRDYFRPYRAVPYSQTLCSTQISWCTSSLEEKEKCEVIRASGISTGVYPLIECRDPVSHTVDCLNDVSKHRADFTGIDSNWGFIARYPYNLTTALYAETDTEKYASVVVVVHANSTYKRFEQLRSAKACIGEFGSIASVAFINTGKNRGFFRKSECRYGKLLSDFFGASCAPGALDLAHAPKGKLDNLCEICRRSDTSSNVVPELETSNQNAPPLFHSLNEDIEVLHTIAPPQTTTVSTTKRNQNCNADTTNSFYGNGGALLCLREEGDVAILELQYLNEHAAALKIDPNDYRIICRNGSLADRTGFDVDPDCALTTIVDGEIVVPRNSPKANGIINALLSFDKYLQSDPDFKMYNIFSGHKDLLFKDSTLGLAARNEDNLGASVENYKKLFANLESCVQGNAWTTKPVTFLIAFVASLQFLNRFFVA